MAEGKADVAGKKPALSSRIMQMKFMQRGKSKATGQEAAQDEVKKEEEDNWVNDAAGPSGCVVLVEGNPPPGAHMGHMSFNSFNPDLERLQDERAALLQNAMGLASPTGDGNGQADRDETKHTRQHRSNKAEDHVVRSIRSNKSRPHRAEKSSTTKAGNKRKRHKSSQ